MSSINMVSATLEDRVNHNQAGHYVPRRPYEHWILEYEIVLGREAGLTVIVLGRTLEKRNGIPTSSACTAYLAPGVVLEIVMAV